MFKRYYSKTQHLFELAMLLMFITTIQTRNLAQGSNTNSQVEDLSNLNAKARQMASNTTGGTGAKPKDTGQNLPPPLPTQSMMYAVNYTIHGKGFKADEGMSYLQIKLDKIDKIDKKYLFFDLTLALKDKWQKVDMNVTVQGTNKLLAQCQYRGRDSCYIPKEKVIGGSVLFVKIKCEDDCRYQFRAQWKDIQHLKMGESPEIFLFGKDSSQLYHLQLDNSTQYEEVRIQIIPRATKRPFDNLKIYGTFKTNGIPTKTHHDFQSVSLWENGEGIFLTKNQIMEKNLNIFVIGQPETTYQMKFEMITTKHHTIQIGQEMTELIPNNTQKKFKVKFETNPKYEEYSIRFLSLKGDATIQYYVDEAMKVQFHIKPFKFMRDEELVLDVNKIASIMASGLHMKVKAYEKDSIVNIKLVGRRKSQAVKLQQNVFSFLPYQKSKLAYFTIKRFNLEGDSISQADIQFSIYKIDVLAQSKIQVRVCTKDYQLCFQQDRFMNNSQEVKINKQSKSSGKTEYDYKLSRNNLQSINMAEEEVLIIAYLTSQYPQNSKENFSLVAVEYINRNKVLYLREARPLQQKLFKQQYRFYKYVNDDPQVAEIRVYIHELSGQVNVEGSIRQDESSEKKMEVVKPINGMLKFDKNLTNTIFVKILALQQARYEITMHIVTKSERERNYNLLTIGEHETYTVTISPLSSTIFEVVPIYDDFGFDYSSNVQVIACVLDPKGKCFKSNDKPLSLSAIGTLTKGQQNDDQRTKKIKILNPFNDKNAEVRVIFHSINYEHCENKKIGEVYDQVLKNGSCYNFTIEKDNKESLQVYVSRREYANFNYHILLCGNKLKGKLSRERVLIDQLTINNLCHNKTTEKQITILWSIETKQVSSVNILKNAKVHFLVQFNKGLKILPEGVSYHAKVTTKAQVLDVFGFKLIDKKKTSIILQPLHGRFKFYAKIVKEELKQISKVNDLSYSYSSQGNWNQKQMPIIEISEEDIKKINCETCSIIVAVYSMNRAGLSAEFNIEFIQDMKKLDLMSTSVGYLEPGSLAYYSYRTKDEDKGAFIIILSDQNQQCANIYLGNGMIRYPNKLNNIKAVQKGNEMIHIFGGGSQQFYIGIEAVEVCDYSISLFTVNSNIRRMVAGTQHLVKKKKDGIAYFSFYNPNNEPFKIITLQKYGTVRLHLNKTFEDLKKGEHGVGELNLKYFQYKSKQFNSLSVAKQDKIFCRKCYYFLAVEAVNMTQTTIYMAYPHTIIPLIPNKNLNDQIKKAKDYTLVSYDRIENSTISVHVFNGSVTVQAVYKDLNQTQVFSASKDHQQTMEFIIKEDNIKRLDPKKPQGVDPQLWNQMKNNNQSQSLKVINRIPINIVIWANQDNSVYSLNIKSKNSKSINTALAYYKQVYPGRPNHIKISNEKALCLNGFTQNGQDKFVLSVNRHNKKYLQMIDIQTRVKSKQVEHSKLQIGNMLQLSFHLSNESYFDKKNKIGEQFEICLKIRDNDNSKSTKNDQYKSEKGDEQEQDKQLLVQAIFSQSSNVDLLPSKSSSTIQGQHNYLIYSDKQLTLDLFNCKGDAKLSVGKTLKDIEKKNAQSTQFFSDSLQSHSLNVEWEGMKYLRVVANHSIIRWFPKDVEKDIGVGYIKFRAGQSKFESVFKQIIIKFQHLQPLEETKAEIISIKYNLFISSNEKQLASQTQCESANNSPTLIKVLLQKDQKVNKEGKYYSYKIKKSQLLKKFNQSNNIYFIIVAQMELISPEDTKNSSSSLEIHENYKFVYGRQQISLSVYSPSSLEKLPYSYLAAGVVSIALLLILLTYLLTRKIFPWIARLKSSNLVEDGPEVPGENDERNREDDLEVPASSDRNQRMPDIVVETQEKMNDKKQQEEFQKDEEEI